MPLQRIEGEITREMYAFAFPTRIAGTAQTVQVSVSDDVFTALGWRVDDVLRTQFDEDRSELEALASEKYEHGRATADGVVLITLSDVVSFFQ